MIVPGASQQLMTRHAEELRRQRADVAESSTPSLNNCSKPLVFVVSVELSTLNVNSGSPS